MQDKGKTPITENRTLGGSPKDPNQRSTVMKHSSADAGRFRVVRVFDGSMNEQVPTYPKRAKGLIKNGRAKWLSEDSIVLIDNISSAGTASDVNFNDTEDKTMSELIYKDLTIDSLLARLEELGGAIADSNDAKLAAISGKLYTDTLDVIKDIKKQNQEVTLAEISSGTTTVLGEDETQKALLARLEELGGALVDSNDIDLAGIIGNLYSETINVVKDVAKQNQEIKLAQLKAAK